MGSNENQTGSGPFTKEESLNYHSHNTKTEHAVKLCDVLSAHDEKSEDMPHAVISTTGQSHHQKDCVA